MPTKDKETFSNVDAAWLRIDEPTNLAVIVGVLLFDHPLDLKWLAAVLTQRLLSYKRFKQRVRHPPLGIGLPTWETDPDFKLSQHLERLTLPAPGDERTLQACVGELMSQPLDPARPLWHVYYVENFNGGCALITRVHHCVADGLSLVQVILSTTDPTPDAPWPAPVKKPRRSWNPFTPLVKRATRTWQMTQDVLEGVNAFMSPRGLLMATALGGSAALALNKLLLIGPDHPTLFKGQCGVEKRVTWSQPIAVQDVKAVGQAMGGTINDILLTVAAGALGRYLEERGAPRAGINIHALVPVNIRPPAELAQLGNRFGLVLLGLPLGLAEPAQRLRVLKKRMDAIKDTPEAVVAFNLLGVIGLTPVQIEKLLIRFFASKASVVMTNVPGPRETLYLAGQPIRRFLFWVPQPGQLGLGVSILSYAGEVVVGIAADANLVPDPETLVRNFHAEFADLQRRVLPSSPAAPEPAKPARTTAAKAAKPKATSKKSPKSTDSILV